MQIPNFTYMRVSQLLSLVLVILFTSSCDDEPALIGEEIFGGNLIGSNLYISSGDTIKAQNMALDAVKFKSKDFLMLGEYNDSIYGNTKAAFLSELSLGASKENATKIHYNDSIEYVRAQLTLKYSINTWIGDTLAKHKVSVYQLKQNLNPEFNYQSDFDPTDWYYTDPIGSEIFDIKDGKRDTAWQVKNHIHSLTIKIDDEVGLRFFDAPSDTINNSKNFRTFFNGVYITTEKQDNRVGSILAIPYAEKGYPSQELAIIYRKKTIAADKTEKWDTLARVFPITKEVPKVISYKNNYTNTNINLSKDENTNVDKIYLQGMGGTLGKINITDEFRDKWKAILRDPAVNEPDGPLNSVAAVFINFYVDTLTDAKYREHLPDFLQLYSLDNNGNYIPISSYNPDVVKEFNGGNKRIVDGAIKYSFSMQNKVFEQFIYPTVEGDSQKKYQEIYLSIPNSSFSFDRAIIHGMDITNGNSNKSIKASNLTVQYVTID